MFDLYFSSFKIWKFAKASARDLKPLKQPPIEEIGVMQRGLKVEILAQGKTKFWNTMGIVACLFEKLARRPIFLFWALFILGFAALAHGEEPQLVIIEELRAIVLSNKPPAEKWKALKGVHLVGIEQIGTSFAWGRFQTDIEKRFLNRPLYKEHLEEIRGAVAVYYKKQGHPFVQVVIPPQEVTEGILHILIEESALDEVTLKGNSWTKDWQILNQVHLKKGHPIDTNTLNADITFLNRNPFRQTHAVFIPGKEILTTDLQLVTKELRPFRAYVGLDNRGNEAFGRLRQFEGFNWGNFLGLNQVLSYQLTTSVQRISNLVAHALYYEIPLPVRQSLVFFGGLSRIQDENVNALTSNEGKNIQGSGRYHIPLFVNQNHVHDVHFGFDFKESNNNALFSEEPIFVNTTNLSQFLLGYQYQSNWKWGAILGNIGLYISPARFFSHQSTDAYRLLSPGSRPKYFYLKGEFSSRFYLPKSFGISYLLTLQYANQNLLPSEQLGLGGFDTVRGYQERVINGDNGIFTSLTVTAPSLSILEGKVPTSGNSKDQLTFLAFLDFGWAQPHQKIYDNVTGELLTQKTESALGVGPGVRYFIDPYLNLAAYWGFRLKKVEAQDSLGGRVNLSLVVSY